MNRIESWPKCVITPLINTIQAEQVNPVLKIQHYSSNTSTYQRNSPHLYLCSTGVGGGHTSGSLVYSSSWVLGRSAGLSILKLSSVFTMLFTCSYSSTSSCLTWIQQRNSMRLFWGCVIAIAWRQMINWIQNQRKVFKQSVAHENPEQCTLAAILQVYWAVIFWIFPKSDHGSVKCIN